MIERGDLFLTGTFKNPFFHISYSPIRLRFYGSENPTHPIRPFQFLSKTLLFSNDLYVNFQQSEI